MFACIRNQPRELLEIMRRVWVGLRPTPHPIRRRKAAAGGSLPASCRSPTSPVDPEQTTTQYES